MNIQYSLLNIVYFKTHFVFRRCPNPSSGLGVRYSDTTGILDNLRYFINFSIQSDAHFFVMIQLKVMVKTSTNTMILAFPKRSIIFLKF